MAYGFELNVLFLDAASRVGVLSLGFVAFIDIAEWLADGEQDLADLLATLAWDLFAVSVSIIAGALTSALVIVTGATLGVSIATGAVIVAVGLGAGILVGIALDFIERRYDLRRRISEAMRSGSINEIDPLLYQGMMTAP